MGVVLRNPVIAVKKPALIQMEAFDAFCWLQPPEIQQYSVAWENERITDCDAVMVTQIIEEVDFAVVTQAKNMPWSMPLSMLVLVDPRVPSKNLERWLEQSKALIASGVYNPPPIWTRLHMDYIKIAEKTLESESE